MRNRNEVARLLVLLIGFCPQLVGQDAHTDGKGTSRVQKAGWSCADDYLRGDKKAVKLSSKKILAHAIEKQAIRPPSEGKFTGTVDIEVVVSAAGEVKCARGKAGNPLAISAALDSLRLWKFRPVLDQQGHPHTFYGTVAVPLQ